MTTKKREYRTDAKTQTQIDQGQKMICYRISGIFRVGLIFAEFATYLQSPKIDNAKIKPRNTSPLRAL